MNCPVIEDILSEEDRFALMIDGANLYQAARALGFDIDYRLLLDTFSRSGPAGAGVLLHGAAG